MQAPALREPFHTSKSRNTKSQKVTGLGAGGRGGQKVSGTDNVYKVNEIPDSARCDPANLLIIGRTIMANERTLLAFLRTSLAFCIAGIGMIKYLDHPLLGAIGWCFAVLAGIFFIWGIHRYRHVRRVLRVMTPVDQQYAEKEMGL